MSRDEISEHCLCDKCDGGDCEGTKELQERGLRETEYTEIRSLIIRLYAGRGDAPLMAFDAAVAERRKELRK